MRANLGLQSGHTHGGQSTALRSRGRSRVTSNRSIMVPAGTRRARIDDHIGAELRVPRTRCPSWELGRCVTERVPRRAAGAELHAPPPCSTSQLGRRVTAGALRRQVVQADEPEGHVDLQLLGSHEIERLGGIERTATVRVLPQPAVHLLPLGMSQSRFHDFTLGIDQKTYLIQSPWPNYP